MIGTPTVIRVAHRDGKMSIVISVSTSGSFTAHHHVYRDGALHTTYGYWYDEAGAIHSHDEWVEHNSPHIE